MPSAAGRALVHVRVVARRRLGRADARRPVRLRRRADTREEAADVGDQRACLARARHAGQQRPRLRLAEDHAAADLTLRAVPARVPAAAGPLAPEHGAQLRGVGSQLRGEGAVAAHVGKLRQPRIDVGELGRDQDRLVHAEERRREVGPVAVRPGQVAAVRPAATLLVAIGLAQVAPERRPAAARPGQPLLEEREVARAEPVLGGRQQQPEVEVGRGAVVGGLAHLGDRVGQEPEVARLLGSAE